MRRERVRGEGKAQEGRGEKETEGSADKGGGKAAEKMERKASHRKRGWAKTWEGEEMKGGRKLRRGTAEGRGEEKLWVHSYPHQHTFRHSGLISCWSVFTNGPVMPPCFLDPGDSWTKSHNRQQGDRKHICLTTVTCTSLMFFSFPTQAIYREWNKSRHSWCWFWCIYHVFILAWRVWGVWNSINTQIKGKCSVEKIISQNFPFTWAVIYS